MERQQRDQGRKVDRSVRVIVADDDPLARRVIREALGHAGLTVVAEASDPAAAVDLAMHHRPDVVLMDVMPNMEGISAMRQILDRVPGVPVVMVSNSDAEELAMLCLRAGAIGFLSKSVELDALPRAARAAATGQAVVSRQLTLRLIEVMRRTSPSHSTLRPVRSALTTREWEVLDLLGRHLSTSEIASALFVSADTVRSHVKHILRKLEVHTRQEAVDVAQSLRARSDDEEDDESRFDRER